MYLYLSSIIKKDKYLRREQRNIISITQKEMTEREQRELKTLLDRARIAHGRVLTNSETNSIKKEYIDKLMVEREAEAKKARQLKKKQAYKPDPEASFSWSANTSTRGRR